MADHSSQNEGKEILTPKPLVSVIMPCYNAERTIVRAVRSAMVQDVALEVLVLDDQSTDGTVKALEAFMQDERVRLITNPEKLGASGGRNVLVRAARGRYIAYLDADDEWAEGKLAKQLQLLEKTGAVLCCTGRSLMDSKGRDTGRYIGVKQRITYRDELMGNQINCSSVVMRRKDALKYPMEHEDAHEDYLTWLRLLKGGGFAVGIDEPLLHYRLSQGGKSGHKWHSAGMTFRTFRYAGMGNVRSLVCFIGYAVHGVLKYAGSRLN